MKKWFPILQPTLTIIFIIIACFVYGLSLAPSILFFNYVNALSGSDSLFLNALIIGVSLSMCFFIFGISLILIVGIIIRILPIKAKPGVYSLASINGPHYLEVSILNPPLVPFDLEYPINNQNLFLQMENILDTLYFSWTESFNIFGDTSHFKILFEDTLGTVNNNGV